MMVHNHTFLIYFEGSVIHFADTDSSHILIIINGADQNLGLSLRISFRSRNIFKNRLKKRGHVLFRIIDILFGKSGSCGCVNERALQLFIRCIQIHKQFQNLIHHIIRSGFRAVYFIDADYNRKIQIQCLSQNKFRLRHRALICVHNKDNAVNHLKNPLNLAAEIGMARRINDVDFRTIIIDRSIF